MAKVPTDPECLKALRVAERALRAATRGYDRAVSAQIDHALMVVTDALNDQATGNAQDQQPAAPGVPAVVIETLEWAAKEADRLAATARFSASRSGGLAAMAIPPLEERANRFRVALAALKSGAHRG